MISEKLYKIGWASLMLRCLGEYKITLVLTEVHQGTCDNYIGRRTLAHKLLREIYYCPTLMKDSEKFVQKCDKFQKHANRYPSSCYVALSILPMECEHPRPFSQALVQFKFLIIRVDYFINGQKLKSFPRSHQKEFSTYIGNR